MKKFVITFLVVLGGNLVFAGEILQKYCLENGQTVIIKEVHSNPIVTIDTWIKTGSINENDKNNGVSHFLEHLFFKGSKNHAPGEFDKILETKGAITNAATSKDFTHYYITIPSKHFEEALSLHADMLLNPLIPRKELEKERKVVLEEIAKDDNSPNKVVYDNLVSMLYSVHPYKRKVIGTRDIIETIHRDEILNYYNTWYSPTNMVTVIVGDVDTDNALAKIKENFVKDAQKNSNIGYAKEKPLTEQKRKVEYLDTQSGYMLIGFRGTNLSDNDSYALDVLATILGDGRSSIFYKNIKDKLQIANSIDASNSGMRDDGIFYISANFSPDKLNKLETEIFNEIGNVQLNGVTENQLNLAKNIIERDTYYQRESNSNIAQEIGYIAAITGDTKFYDNYIENIKKVTAQDVKKASNKYLGKEKSAVSIVLPKQTKEVKISDKTPHYHAPQLISENFGTLEYKLANNATLLLTPNETNEIIAISIFAKGGNFVEEKYGIANLTASTMLKGTKNYSTQELAEILEDNGIKIQPSTRSDAFTISVLTTKPQYEKTLELLTEVVNNATFSEFELDKVKKDKLNAIKKNRDLPLNVAMEGYKNQIFANTPYSNSIIELEKNIPQISRTDVVKYYNKIFNPNNIIVSINGDVDRELTNKTFSKMFKSTSTDTINFENFANQITPPTQPRTEIKQNKDTNTDWIFLGWQTAGLSSPKEYATLEVIDSLLGTGMGSRLFKNLRDQEGLAYQLGSGYSANVLKGSFVVYIGTNPNTYDKALKGLWNEINKLKTEFVGTKELQEAKEKLIGQFTISQETNLDKSSTIGWFETAGRKYTFVKDYENLVNSVTETDIMNVANRYFQENAYILSSVKK